MEKQIYLDYNATTPVHVRVLEEMLPWFTDQFWNAASSHHLGAKARNAVETGREQVAELIGCQKTEIIFTSGATESNNLAIKGVSEFYGDKKNHIITCVTEHKCVLESCRHLSGKGFEVTYLPVESDGLINLNELERAITDKTLMVSVMGVHNEIGVIQPLEKIGQIWGFHHINLYKIYRSQTIQGTGNT